jgi:catechol 2,3-dioxygenase-like lactoylglutathione lyase family enzyme
MAVSRVGRLGLTVRSAESMARFYQAAFGCRVIAASDGDAASLGVKGAGLRCISLGLGQQIIDLAGFDPPGAPWPAASRSNDFIFQHFAIAVTDMAEAYRHLRTVAGWTPISPAGPVTLPQSSGGVTAFKFRDPEGHPLELLEFPGTPPAGAALFHEINHSAIVVKDTGRSLAFYAGALGLSPGKPSNNHGAEQARLDDLDQPRVRVTPLMPAGQATPHVELLCYEEPESGGAPPNTKTAADLIATRIAFIADDLAETLHRAIAAGGSVIARHPYRALLRDPDGHDLVIEQEKTS